MSDMNIERQRLSQQMRQDLSELKFSAAMREAVLASVRAEEMRQRAAAGVTVTPVATGRPELRAVPPRPASAARGRLKRWQRAGIWLTGGSVAAAAVVLGLALANPAPGSGLPQQRVAQAPEAAAGAPDEEFVVMSLGGDENGDAADTELTATAMLTEADVPVDAAEPPAGAGAPESAPADPPAGGDEEQEPEEDGADEPADGSDFGLATETEDKRPGAGVAAQQTQQMSNGQPDSRSSNGRDDGSTSASSRATLKELSKEAQLIVLAQVQSWKGRELKLVPVLAYRGDLPDGELTVTMPAGKQTLKPQELVVVFLMRAEGGPGQSGKKLPDHARPWRLVGGMAGIFRLSTDGHVAESESGVIDLEDLRDEVR